MDGFIAREDGDIKWLVRFENEEVHESYQGFIRTIDAVAIGRGTFEKVLTYPSWPYEHRVFVLSTSIKQLPKSVEGKADLLSMRPRAVLSHLSEKGISRVYVDGGKVIQDFLREDCIDEMIITKVPVVLGNGIPLFGSLDATIPFRHVRTTVFSNGLVKSHYERERTRDQRSRGRQAAQ